VLQKIISFFKSASKAR